MATHNQTRTVGFLLKDPHIINEGQIGAEKIFYSIRTIRRDVDNFRGARFQDVLVYYDGTEYMERMKRLVQFDVVDIKGVFNILTTNKGSTCPDCGCKNAKTNGASCFIYPISFHKLNALETAFEHDEKLPERILDKYYKEVSNQALIIGTIVNEPELIGTEKNPCCRYRLGVDRKYYIATQGETTADYPWVYSYGQQAEWDFKYLKKESVILVDGFMQTRRVKSRMTCTGCGKEYTFDDAATEFVPYAIEYLQNFLTDEDIAEIEADDKSRELMNAKNEIFSD